MAGLPIVSGFSVICLNSGELGELTLRAHISCIIVLISHILIIACKGD